MSKNEMQMQVHSLAWKANNAKNYTASYILHKQQYTML